ncbi:hypothetical protein [Kitasatospora sp. NPDC088346]|uniref:hypothetical protein n=1 Tax=Kitasatospora sp. NPDC088346 TaxID=3364073 RepID=UPI0037F7B005
MRVAPLVFYPEAVRLAHALAARERLRLRRTLTDGHEGTWLARTADLVGSWGIPLEPALYTLAMWTSQHPRQFAGRKNARSGPASARPARGRHRRLPSPTTPTEHDLDATLGERSCLPWQLGELRTTSLIPAIDGWTAGGRA